MRNIATIEEKRDTVHLPEGTDHQFSSWYWLYEWLKPVFYHEVWHSGRHTQQCVCLHCGWWSSSSPQHLSLPNKVCPITNEQSISVLQLYCVFSGAHHIGSIYWTTLTTPDNLRTWDPHSKRPRIVGSQSEICRHNYFDFTTIRHSQHLG